jgi:hypothetical protein
MESFRKALVHIEREDAKKKKKRKSMSGVPEDILKEIEKFVLPTTDCRFSLGLYNLTHRGRDFDLLHGRNFIIFLSFIRTSSSILSSILASTSSKYFAISSS